MVLRRRAELAATSRADDLALRAHAEIVEITRDENVRIVGGQMVSLLLAAFPVSGIALRTTRDADTAITTELAGSGVLHDRLIARGWVGVHDGEDRVAGRDQGLLLRHAPGHPPVVTWAGGRVRGG